MRKLLFVFLVLTLLVSGCTQQMKDIDTGKQLFGKNCSFILGVDHYSYIVDNHCDYVCSQEGLNDVGWKCSDNETVVCKCSK